MTHAINFYGVHGVQAIENTALPRIADALDSLENRIKALENRMAPDNASLIAVLEEADKAIAKALAHFSKEVK